MSTARKIYRGQNSKDNELNNKVSNHIQTQLPEFIQADHPVFSQFVRLYYQFLESAELVFLETNNYLNEETQTINFILDEDGEKVVLEDSEVKFTIGETLQGQTSGATAKVLVDDVDDNKRLFVTSQTQFIIGETVVGLSSNSSGTLQSYKPNPVSSIQQLLNYANVDSTIFTFLDKFRDSFLEGIVDNVNTGVDKRKLIKNIRDLYISKGTRKGHELFFRLLLNEEPTITYPTEQMLRLSDGKWTTKTIIRAEPVEGNASELVGQVITGIESGSTGIVTSSITFRENNRDVVELEIDKETKSGDFLFPSTLDSTIGETVTGISTVTDRTVSIRPFNILTGITVTNSGSYYTPEQKVNVSTGTATAKIQTVVTGKVDEVIIDDAGTGYKVGENLLVDNSGTNGTGFSAQVSVVGGGIEIESGSVTEYGMTTGDHITMEESSQSFYQDSYEGTKIVLETATHGDAPGSQASEATEITDIRIVSGGVGYTKLPTLDKTNKYNTFGQIDNTGQVYSTGVLTTNGTGAKLLPVTNTGMGGVGSFEIVNQGIEYSSAPTLNSFRHAVLKDITGTFNSNTSLTSHTGTVSEFDINRQLISIDTTANLVVGNTVSTTTGSGVIANIDTAVGTAQVGTFTETSGNFLDNDGLLSNELQRIQDSFYYQDYSYVVRVGDSINTWRDAIKSTVHPAGWNVFGEVEVVGSVSAKVSVQTLDSYSPEFASALRGVFTTVFGRRLGTVDDGTSIRANSKVGTNELSDLTSTTRDVTLTPKRNVIIGSARTARRTGPTLDLLAKYAFAVPPIPDNAITANYPNFTRTARTNHNDGAYFTIEQFANFKIEQVSLDITQNHFDSSNLTFDSGNIKFDNGLDTTIPSAAFNTNINVPPPGQINLIQGGGFTSFDETGETFDSGNKTFDIG
tara:strand:+ start:436 stop:3171 length:2736 start_codon:yes stop_codon:yes gene_type:complete